jgi:twin BRCT domain
MDAFVKPIKPASTAKTKSTTQRPHPYKSHADQIKEKCCVPRPIGNIYTSSSTGHQVSQGPGKAAPYFHSRNAKLAQQFKRDPVPPPAETTRDGVLFRNCCVYVNGYMGPTISDLELKKRLAQHGARVVAHFGRKSVTHVILGPNGLASGKIQKEMLARKMGVKYVTVDWYASLRFIGIGD